MRGQVQYYSTGERRCFRKRSLRMLGAGIVGVDQLLEASLLSVRSVVGVDCDSLLWPAILVQDANILY